MLVHFVTDTPTKIPAIRAVLEPEHSVHSHLLGVAAQRILSNGVLIVDADLRHETLEQVKAILRNLQCISEKLFVVQGHLRHMVGMAFGLGATAVVSRTSEIASRLRKIEISRRASDSASERPEVANSAAVVSSMFSEIRRGKQISLLDAEHATLEVVNGIKRSGLNAWLDDVRRYHEGTFQHCLLVTGVAVAFALHVKFPDADVKRLGLAATLHDVGKARIPLAILDKPGLLDPTEQDIMNRHPVIGYDLLKSLPELSPEILDGVRHHHEYLDGSGYPDGLSGSQISDLIRLLTISDIFAALIERRPYRPSMSRHDAYNVLCGMEGKLERPLLRAFRSVALAG